MALSSCPPPAGSEAAAEGEGDLPILVLAPSSEWHNDNCAVVFRAKLRCLPEETQLSASVLHLEKETSVWLHLGQHALGPEIPLLLPGPDAPFWYIPVFPVGSRHHPNHGLKLAISVCDNDISSTGIGCRYSPMQFSGL